MATFGRTVCIGKENMKFRQYVEKEIQARKNADPIKKYVSSDNWAKE